VKKASLSVATLAAIGASVLGVLAVAAGPAAAKKQCVLVSKNTLAPHLVSPCNGATLKEGVDVTFKVSDDNSQAGKYHPFLAVRTDRKLTHGHLVPQTDGNGVYAQLTPVKGHNGEWIVVSKHQIYPSWWDNHKGTVYVQVQQIDSRAGISGTFYSPIVTIHVS
jgi:hypothetical protein